jgi:hypothetical protein
MAAPRTRRIRGKRARAKWRPHGRDLRCQYREADLPAASRLAVDVIEDPFPNLEIGAQLEPAHHADGTIAEGEPGWTPPRRPLVTIVRSLRDDPIGRMHSRRQIDGPQYAAAREYQAIFDACQIGSMRSVDLEKLKVDGGLPPEPLTDHRQRAARRLRSVDGTLVHHHGHEGLALLRGVLADRRSIEQTARLHGAQSERDVRSIAWLFRQCLNVIARAFGLATSTKRLPRAVIEPEDPSQDPGRHADARDLADVSLRRGRPNGG